jgi:hypothetical protein
VKIVCRAGDISGQSCVAAGKGQIKFGVLDAIGASKDLLKKGFHLLKELRGLELSLQYTEESGGVGKVVLGYLTGNEGMAKDAVKVFNQAMANKMFKQSLLVK